MSWKFIGEFVDRLLNVKILEKSGENAIFVLARFKHIKKA